MAVRFILGRCGPVSGGDADMQREPAEQHMRADAGLESVEYRP